MRHINRSKLFGIFAIIVLIAAVGVTVFVSQRRQEIRQHAAEDQTGKIIVSGKQLIDSASTKPFVVRSVQYSNIVYIDSNGVRFDHNVPGSNAQISTFSTKNPHFSYPLNDYSNPPNDPKVAFSQIKAQGYNTVRLVFHNSFDALDAPTSSGCKEGTTYNIGACIDTSSVRLLGETIQFAKYYNLKVILSFVGWPYTYSPQVFSPQGQPITAYGNNNDNIVYLDSQVMRDLGRYYKDLFTFLKTTSFTTPIEPTDRIPSGFTEAPLDFSTILAVQPIAEPYLDSGRYPFDRNGKILSAPEFNIAAGKSYTVNSVLTSKVDKGIGRSSQQMKEILQQSMTSAFNYWFSQIKSVDPTILVMYDQFPEVAVFFDGFRNVSDSVITDSSLQADIVGMQSYLNFALPNFTSDNNINTLFQYNPSFVSSLTNIQKPFIVTETGLSKSYKTSHPNYVADLLNWQESTCQLKPAGWSLFYWSPQGSADSDFEFVTAQANSNELAYALSPAAKPTVCPQTSPPSPLKSGIGTFNFSNGQWSLRNSASVGNADIAPFVYNPAPGGTPVVGDWTGKGYKSVGMFKDGTWYLKNSNSSGDADAKFTFGQSGDLPIIGDWTGDGKDKIGVYRNGTFYLRNSNTSGVADTVFTFGNPTDTPIVGDWTHKGYDSVGVVRDDFQTGAKTWFLKNTNAAGNADITFGYGLAGDMPIVGDWTGKGNKSVGVVRGNVWFLKNTNSSGFADTVFLYGLPGSIPVTGVWTQSSSSNTPLSEDKSLLKKPNSSQPVAAQVTKTPLCQTIYAKIVNTINTSCQNPTNAKGATYDKIADVNKDGQINGFDINEFLRASKGTDEAVCTQYLQNTADPCKK